LPAQSKPYFGEDGLVLPCPSIIRIKPSLYIYLFSMSSFQETIFNLLAKSLNKEKKNNMTFSKILKRSAYNHKKARAA